MKNEIARKIQREIDVGISSEAQVVYVLAGLRKIIEQSENSKGFGRLKFYCDWALHSRMSGPPAQDVVKILESIYNHMVDKKSVPDRSEAMLLTKFELLKEEVSNFLQQLHLTDFTKAVNDWMVFIFLYSRVVQDCPLVMHPDVKVGIKMISIQMNESVRLIDDHLPFKVTWKFDAKDDFPSAEYFVLNTYSVRKTGRL